MNGEIQFDPVPFDEASKIVADRPVVSREVFMSLLPELRARSFLISGVEDMNVAQQVRDLIAEIPRGAGWEETKKKIVEKLGPWMDPEAADRRAVLLMRHHGFQAYAAAKYEKISKMTETFPYWKYLTMGDELVREAHSALHGLMLPADDPFWKDHFPPWDWGCRCVVVPILRSSYDEAVADGRVAGQKPLPMSERRKGWTLGPEGVKALHLGKLDLGDGMPIDVRSPLQRATTASERLAAYRWHPGDLRLNLDQLRSRYDAETFAEFEKNARNTPIGDGRTVWQWLEGKPAAAPAEQSAIDLPISLDDKIVEVEKQIQEKPVEHLVLLDGSGKERFHRVVGSKTQVALPPASVGKISGFVLLHNHPSCTFPENRGFPTSLSIQDVQLAVRENLGSIRAVGVRRSYHLEPGPAGWPSEYEIIKAYADAKKRAFAKLEILRLAGRISEWKENQILNHLIWKEVAKRLGMKYIAIRR